MPLLLKVVNSGGKTWKVLDTVENETGCRLRWREIKSKLFIMLCSGCYAIVGFFDTVKRTCVVDKGDLCMLCCVRVIFVLVQRASLLFRARRSRSIRCVLVVWGSCVSRVESIGRSSVM